MLLDPDITGLENVDPLYKPDTFVLFDQYADGDPYADENYIACFKVILQAIHEKRMLRIRFHSHTGLRHSLVCMPSCLEYSAKDGKFRVLSFGPVSEVVAPTDFIVLAKERLARQNIYSLQRSLKGKNALKNLMSLQLKRFVHRRLAVGQKYLNELHFVMQI